MLARELTERQQGSIEALGKAREPDPFVFSPQMVHDLELMRFSHSVLSVASVVRPGRRALPAARGGRPLEYRGESIWVTILVMVVWQLSPEGMVRLMWRWPD